MEQDILPRDREFYFLLSRSTWITAAIVAVTISSVCLMPVPARAQTDSAAKYVGVEVCAGCHQTQAEHWKTSHHALAMQKATPATVLGDFSGVSVENFGVVSTFSRVGDKFMVRTDGRDGVLHDYEITHTFGIDPLQQYLIAFPDGRYQMFGLAWDTRPKEQGGQRWFHLYPDEKPQPGSLLHWTGRDQTWNYMCADCHTTGLKKNYDLSANTYATTWVSLGVTCESCHGPGSRHVAMAKSGLSPAPASRSGLSEKARTGLEAWLKATDSGRWEMNPATGTARRTEPLVSTQLDTCAPCHSRRKLLATGLAPDTPFLDVALPALLEPGLYHADGQIDGEVFEYDSFLQSTMHKAGVVCSNCHEPHAAKLRAQGNALCAQCHLPEKFDVTAHHKHSPGSAGAQCVNCHMPTKTYMVVHDRRDHSIARSAARPVGVNRHAERLHPVSHRTLGGMGGKGRRNLVSEREADKAALWHRPLCRSDRRRRCGTPTRSTNSGQKPTRDCAGERLAPSVSLCIQGFRACHQSCNRRPGPTRSHGRTTGTAAIRAAVHCCGGSPPAQRPNASCSCRGSASPR